MGTSVVSTLYTMPAMIPAAARAMRNFMVRSVPGTRHLLCGFSSDVSHRYPAHGPSGTDKNAPDTT
jgi:hypothetical protein